MKIKSVGMKKAIIGNAAVVIAYSVLAVSAQIAVIETPVETEFATYEPQETGFTPRVRPYTIAPDLSDVYFRGRVTLDDEAKNMLAANGFFAVPSRTNTLHESLTQTVKGGMPVFVTTDALLHSFHIIYDYMLRIAEHERFYFQLDSLLTSLLAEIRPLMDFDGADSLHTAIVRTAALLETASRLLTGETDMTVPAVNDMVEAELSLIDAHQGFALSHTVQDLREDFSQYVPRGHYTRNDRFKRYFRSMMYLGRMNMRVINRMETLQACILTRLLSTAQVGNVDASDLWEKMYQPTVFFVGRSDDLNFKEYKGVLDEVLGDGWEDGDIAAIRANFNDIAAGLEDLRPPLILSGWLNPGEDAPTVTKGFRIMGQRFIPDSYMFGKLVYPYIDRRLMPRGLDVLAVMGSARAYTHLIELYEEDACPGYTDTLETLKEEFASLPASRWAENLYWNWLYALVPLLSRPGPGYPFFMTTPAWADKTLATASGSWAELRHDTILYAKQSFTGYSSVPPSVCVFQGYVEPNPGVFGRLAALAGFMHEGFSDCELTPVLPLEKLTQYRDLCISLRDIAVKQLEYGNISSEEYSTIGKIGNILSGIENFNKYQFDKEPGAEPDADTTMAIIADVHTDPNSRNVLEVGVGKAMDIYVIVPVEGKKVLCRGAMFSYYEFKHPMNDRLTDEKWQGMLADGTAPPMPEWSAGFVHDGVKAAAGGEASVSDPVKIDADKNVYSPGESITLTITSTETPTAKIRREGFDDIEIDFSTLGSPPYTYEIPPTVLSTDSAVVEVSAGGGVFRKLLLSSSMLAAGEKRMAVKRVRACEVRGNTVHFGCAGTWRVFDLSGRLLYTAPERASSVRLPDICAGRAVILRGTTEQGDISRAVIVR